MRDLVGRIANELTLSRQERKQMISSGTMTVITSRVHWAKTYLKRAGLVEQTKRAHVQISARGREVLSRNPVKIDNMLLQDFKEFRDFLGRTKSEDAPARSLASTQIGSSSTAVAVETVDTPEEQIASAFRTLIKSLRDALPMRVLERNPTFFKS